MKNFFAEIKERKIRKWIAIYLSTAITIMGVTHLLSLRYKLPDFIFDTVFFSLLLGILGTIVFAWFHGKEGEQKIKVTEIVLQSILATSLFLILYLTVDYNLPVKKVYNEKIIAVLPFVNLNETKENEFIADGITEDILNLISKISDLKVISRTSVMKYKNAEKNISEISEELGAGTILEWSVRRAGDKVRITGQLINANKDEHIWAETFDRKIDDIFAVQSEIAKQITKELEATLAAKEVLLIEAKPTNNIEVYAFCLKGRKFASMYNDEDNEKAIEFYKKHLRLIPPILWLMQN